MYVTHDQVEAMTLGDRVAVMRDGRLQQADTPQHLFDFPANLFVAGFIGSPSMNLVDAELVRDDGPAVVFGSFRLSVPDDLVSERSGLDGYFGKKVILGVRPNNFEDAELARSGGQRGRIVSLSDQTAGGDHKAEMKVTAELIEELGSEVNVIFEIDSPVVTHDATTALAQDVGQEEEAVQVTSGHSLWTARVDPHTTVKPGGEITLEVDTSALHFFDPESGLAIGRS